MRGKGQLNVTGEKCVPMQTPFSGAQRSNASSEGGKCRILDESSVKGAIVNILLLSACEAVQAWLCEGVASFDQATEINRCTTLDFGLRVLQVHDEVHMIVVDEDLVGTETADAVKRLWRACGSAAVIAVASAPSMSQMVACVNAGAVGYLPRGLQGQDLVKVLAHVSEGGHWLPDLRAGRSA